MIATTETATAHTPEDELVDAGAGILVGGGIVTMALFPFALPAIAMAAVLALPFVLVGIAAAVVAAPMMLVRKALARAEIRSSACPTVSTSRSLTMPTR